MSAVITSTATLRAVVALLSTARRMALRIPRCESSDAQFGNANGVARVRNRSGHRNLLWRQLSRYPQTRLCSSFARETARKLSRATPAIWTAAMTNDTTRRAMVASLNDFAQHAKRRPSWAVRKLTNRTFLSQPREIPAPAGLVLGSASKTPRL
jgi:hypothetical protein